jgi:nicotinamide riboside kinase
VLFCDTDTFVTAVFYEVYMGTPDPELERRARESRYSLYLLCDVDTPFHRDRLGLRREDARLTMHRRYADYVRSTGSPWVAVSGAHEERMKLATTAVDALFS